MKKSHHVGMSALLASFLLLFAAGCASAPSAYRDLSMVEVTEDWGGKKIGEGKIVFSEDKGLLASLFGKKEEMPEVSASDIAIRGRRTASEEPKKTSTNNKIIKILDAIVRDDSWKYDWKGTVETDGVQIPVDMTMRVTDGIHKIYRLNYANSHSHEKAKGFTGNLKKFFGADLSVRLSVENPIDTKTRTVPFEMGRFTMSDTTEFHIHAMRTLADSSAAVKPTVRNLLFSRSQRYQITDKANMTVYADCTVDSFTLYEGAADGEDKTLLLKECIGLFTAWLWSLDEHERTSSMLN